MRRLVLWVQLAAVPARLALAADTPTAPHGSAAPSAFAPVEHQNF